MFVLKKYKFTKEEKQLDNNENPIFTDKVNLKAKWTYAKTDKIEGYDLGVKKGNQIMINHMEKLYEILSKNNIKLSLAVYPWPHQLENDVVNSKHVKIWQEFCQNKCEKFINYFPIFFKKMNNSSYLETYKKYYFKNDPHFNKIGHKVLAAELIRSF
mgnify:FL=1